MLAQEMDDAAVAKIVADVDVLQPQCWNFPEADFKASLQGAAVTGVRPRASG